MIGPETGHISWPGAPGSGGSDSPASSAARRSLARRASSSCLLLAHQRFERGFGFGRGVLEFADLNGDVLLLGLGQGQQVLTLLREGGQREPLLLGVGLRVLQARFGGEQAGLDRLRRARASARRWRIVDFVGLDHVADVVPALDEVAERLGVEQHGDVAEVAVFVGVDQAAFERVVVALQRLLRGGELAPVPGQAACGRVHPVRSTCRSSLHGRDVVVGDVELLADRADFRLRRIEFAALEIQLRMDDVHLGLLAP